MRNTKGYVDIEELPGYEINRNGVIKNKETGCIRKLCISKRGYKVINVKVNNKYRLYSVHRLVAKAFIPNPLNLPEVNHINGDKTNNRVSNLEWVTSSQNSKHKWDTGLCTYDNRDKRKMVLCYNKEGIFIKEYESLTKASRELGLSRGSIGNVCRGIGKTYGGYIWKFKQ